MGWSVGAGVAALVAYLALAPGVAGEGDGSELTLALALGGVPHPTGYPLYVLLGAAFCAALHAMGISYWYAASAWSAVGAALAVFFLHALAARVGPARRSVGPLARAGVALVPAGLFTLHPLWIPEATLAEVNSWHLAWVGGACLLFLGLLSRTERGGRGVVPTGWAGAWGLVCGLGLAHHRTAALFVVPLTLVLIWTLARSGRWRWTHAAAGAAGAILPLASYAFVWYRANNAAAFQWPLLLPTAGSVVGHVTGRSFGFFLGRFASAEALRALWNPSVVPFLACGFALLLLGARRADPTTRRFLAGVGLASGLQLIFVLSYGVIDPTPYVLPLLLVALLGASFAGAWAAARRGSALALGAITLVGLAALGSTSIRSAQARTERLREVESRIRAAWNAIPYREAIVLWRNDLYVRLKAYQLLDGEKRGLYVENPNMLTWEGPRRAFEERFGFDPLAQLALRSDADLAFVPMNIRRQTQTPVVDFEEALWVVGRSAKLTPTTRRDAGWARGHSGSLVNMPRGMRQNGTSVPSASRAGPGGAQKNAPGGGPAPPWRSGTRASLQG